MRTILVCLFVSFAAIDAKAQATATYTDTAPPPSARFPANWYPQDDPYSTTEAPVTGVPYSATMVTTYALPPSATPRLQFGLVQRTPWYRDSMGRTRKEEYAGSPYKSPDDVIHDRPKVRQVEVNDTVSHCQFRWTEPWVYESEPVATVFCLHRVLHYSQTDPFAYIVKQQARVDDNDPFTRIEPLGKKEFAGFEAVGIRRVTSNPQALPPLNVAVEAWYSPQLHELLRFGPVPPSSGMPIFEMKDIQLGEPNPDLFYPPSNYRIVSGRP